MSINYLRIFFSDRGGGARVPLCTLLVLDIEQYIYIYTPQIVLALFTGGEQALFCVHKTLVS